jgi:hypothetical protein
MVLQTTWNDNSVNLACLLALWDVLVMNMTPPASQACCPHAARCTWFLRLSHPVRESIARRCPVPLGLFLLQWGQ